LTQPPRGRSWRASRPWPRGAPPYSSPTASAPPPRATRREGMRACTRAARGRSPDVCVARAGAQTAAGGTMAHIAPLDGANWSRRAGARSPDPISAGLHSFPTPPLPHAACLAVPT
jgi:hypothetical protein